MGLDCGAADSKLCAMARFTVEVQTTKDRSRRVAIGVDRAVFGANATITGSGFLLGTAGNDVIVGSEDFDVIDGLGGDDRVCSLGGDDIVRGGLGNDMLDAGEPVFTDGQRPTTRVALSDRCSRNDRRLPAGE